MKKLLKALRDVLARFDASDDHVAMVEAIRDYIDALGELLFHLAFFLKNDELKQQVEVALSYPRPKSRLTHLHAAARRGKGLAADARRSLIAQSQVPRAVLSPGNQLSIRKVGRTDDEIDFWSCSIELAQVDRTIPVMLECLDLRIIAAPNLSDYAPAVAIAMAQLRKLLTIYGNTSHSDVTALALNYLALHQYWTGLIQPVRSLIGGLFEFQRTRNFDKIMRLLHEDRTREDEASKEDCHDSLSNEAVSILDDNPPRK